MKLIKQIIFIALLMGNVLAYGNPPIVVGVSKFAPPFSAVDTSNHDFGFCVDLINELCKRLNETCKYTPVAFDNLMDKLDDVSVDITFSPSPISQIEEGNYIYSMPYMTSNGQFLTLDANIKSINDIKNKRLGAMQERHLDDTLLLYTSKENIKEYTRVNQLLGALISNAVDAIILKVNLAKYLINNKVRPHPQSRWLDGGEQPQGLPAISSN
ncbi:MAG: transporter substrate-binding domain-containing protein [Legionella sp.]